MPDKMSKQICRGQGLNGSRSVRLVLHIFPFSISQLDAVENGLHSVPHARPVLALTFAERQTYFVTLI